MAANLQISSAGHLPNPRGTCTPQVSTLWVSMGYKSLGWPQGGEGIRTLVPVCCHGLWIIFCVARPDHASAQELGLLGIADAMSSGNISTSSEEKKEHNSTCSQDLFKDQGFVRGLIMTGMKAIKSKDIPQLLDFFRRSQGLRAEHYGDLAPKCAELYYRVGSKFMQRARGNSDIGAKKVSESTCNEGNLEQGVDDKDQEEYKIEYGDSHLKLALYSLNAAKELIEKQRDTLGKAKIFKALGDVFLTIGSCINKAFGEFVAKGSFEQSVSYYENVLAMWPQMVEPDSSSMPQLILEILRTLKTEYRIAEYVSFCEKVRPKCEAYRDQLIKWDMGFPDNILQILKEKYGILVPHPSIVSNRMEDDPSIVSDPMAAEENTAEENTAEENSQKGS